MFLSLVRHGDRTTTGGFVMAFSSTMDDGGKKIALFGDRASCGSCEGSYPIYGSGKGMSEQGRDVVVNGDTVLCPCGKNRVIAGGDAGCSLERHEEVLAANETRGVGGRLNQSIGAAFDEQVRASTPVSMDVDGYPYLVETEDGRMYSGRLNSSGLLPRVFTKELTQYSVVWGDDALAQWEVDT